MENTLKKLEILAEDAQYDLACACGSGKQFDSSRKRGEDGRWLYPVTVASGGRGLLLKTLQSNCCSNDCKYCPLRNNANARRCSLSPAETARIFMDYHRRRPEIFGMFLSSGIVRDPDFTMQRLLDTAAILRQYYRFKGYIHLKVIPGASDAAVEEALRLATAVSLNIEAPGEKYFRKLSDAKQFERDIVHPLKLISNLTARGSKYAKVKASTQFIVGAAGERDNEIVNYMDAIYTRLKFERVYFSAYQPGLGDASIPGEQNFHLAPEARFTREHRLYQCDFLLRTYGFKKDELVFERDGSLSLASDPKEVWAQSHPEFFPVNINKADKLELMRIPAIGAETAVKIIRLRAIHRLSSLMEAGLKGKQLQKAGPYACA